MKKTSIFLIGLMVYSFSSQVSYGQCVSEPGTFKIYKDPVGSDPNTLVNENTIELCEGDAISLISNGDYILPNNTIAQPLGDGIYSAQLMWLIYDAVPSTNDPGTDPGFAGMTIPQEDFLDVNNGASPIVNLLGCGTYWLVPVAGDDGVGGNNGLANGTNDNGSLHWDRDGDDCFLLGQAIEVTYNCPIQSSFSLNCNPPGTINGVNISLTGGTGSYTIVNMGSGDLYSSSVANPGTAVVANLENGDLYSIEIEDQAGCSHSYSGTFDAPVITDITLTAGTGCPAGTPGTVDVTASGTSGNGGPYSIVMATDPATIGTTDSYSNLAGTIVPIVVSDGSGCITDSIVTIPSTAHFIDITITSLSGELCYGDGNGAATITAMPTPSGSVTSIVWSNPLGSVVGNTSPTHLAENSMMPGNWTVCVNDDSGCEVCVPVEITSPQQLQIFVDNYNDPVCYGFNDGSIDVGVTGGTQPHSFSWNHNGGVTSDVANQLSSGSYVVYAIDNNGCEDSIEVFITDPDSLYSDIIVVDNICFEDSVGSIKVDNIYGSFGNTSYYWNLGAIPAPTSTSDSAVGLPNGSYMLTIQDENGCINEYNLAIDSSPSLDFLYVGSNHVDLGSDGVAYATASGGSPGYSYLWTNLSNMSTTTDSTWSGLDVGSYQIVVTDANGCTLVDTVYIGYLTVDDNKALNDVQLITAKNGKIFVQNNFNSDFILKFYDISGRTLDVVNILPGGNSYEVELPTGVYIYSVIGDSGFYKSERIFISAN
jgi:hypothetical protein